jgi:predicted Zn-dependent protease
MIEKAKASRLGTSAALLAGVIAGRKDAEAGQAIVNTSLATMAHRQLSFSREAESEADHLGLQILARSGFNPKGMPAILQKLESFASGNSADIREFLQNHPLTHKRVIDTQLRAKRLGTFKGRESKQYYFMREKVRALTHSTLPVPTKVSPNIKKYAQAQQLKKRRAYSSALKVSGVTSKQISNAILIAQLLNQLGKYEQTITLLSPLLDLYPGGESLSIPLGLAYSATGQAEKGWQLLNAVPISELTSLELFEAKQKVTHQSGRRSQAYLAIAEKNIRTGHYKSAKTQLHQAAKLAHGKNKELQVIRHRLASIKNYK